MSKLGSLAGPALAAGVVSGVVGFLAGRYVPRAPDPELLAESRQWAAVVQKQQEHIDALSSRLRSLALEVHKAQLRPGADATQAPSGALPASAGPAAEPRPPAEPDTRTHAEAIAVVDAAVARHKFTLEDRISLNRRLRLLSPEQGAEVRARLAKAVASGALKMDPNAAE